MVLDPNNVDIQLSLGDLFMAQNDLDKAIKTSVRCTTFEKLK